MHWRLRFERLRRAFTVGFLFFFACWAVTATSDLVLDLAAKRLDQTLPPVKESLHTIRSAAIAIAFVLNCYAIFVAKEAGLSKQMLRITLGLLVGLVAGFVLFAVLQYFEAVVSPAARPKLAESSAAWSGTRDQAGVDPYHLVDGGYFDNSGLTAVSAWLDDALQDLYFYHPEKVPGKILVIEIKPFPDAADNKSDSGKQNADTFLHPFDTIGVMSARPEDPEVDVPEKESLVVGRFELNDLDRLEVLLTEKFTPSLSTVAPRGWGWPGSTWNIVCRGRP
jgi:hypothetical protein